MGQLLKIHEARNPATLKTSRKENIIYDVKIIGFDSENDRKYLPSALKAAISLYEGVNVNVDHPEDPTKARSAYDRIGKLINVRFIEGKGLFADLWLNPSHELTPNIFTAAEKMPDQYGLSHNAQGEGETKDGVFIVSKITEVRSVDLVADPATTKSLSESKAMPKKMKEAAPSMKQNTEPIQGGPNAKYHKLTDVALLWNIKEAREAYKNYEIANGQPEKGYEAVYNKYRDQAIEISDILRWRKRNGMPNWYRKKYGHKLMVEKPVVDKEKKLASFKTTGPTVRKKAGGNMFKKFKEASDGFGNKAYSKKKILDMIRNSGWESDMDVTVGKRVTLRNARTKKKMVNVLVTEDVKIKEDNSNKGNAMKSVKFKEAADEVKKKVTEALREAEGDDDELMAEKIMEIFKESFDDEPIEEDDEEEVDTYEAEGDDEDDTMEAEGDDEDEVTEGEDDEDTEVTEGENDEDDPMEEGRKHRLNTKVAHLQEEVRTMKKTAWIKAVCKKVRLPLTRDLLEDLRSMPKASILRQAKRLAVARRLSRPKSGMRLTEGKTKIPTGNDLYNWLQN